MSNRRVVLLVILFILVGLNVWSYMQMNFDRQLPDPVPIVTESFHKDGDDEAWIMKVEDDGTVWVQTVDDKTNIHFRPSSRHLSLFSEHINKIAGVTFECGKEPEEECDLSKPYKLYIKNVLVEALGVQKKTAN